MLFGLLNLIESVIGILSMAEKIEKAERKKLMIEYNCSEVEVDVLV